MNKLNLIEMDMYDLEDIATFNGTELIVRTAFIDEEKYEFGKFKFTKEELELKEIIKNTMIEELEYINNSMKINLTNCKDNFLTLGICEDIIFLKLTDLNVDNEIEIDIEIPKCFNINSYNFNIEKQFRLCELSYNIMKELNYFCNIEFQKTFLVN